MSGNHTKGAAAKLQILLVDDNKLGLSARQNVLEEVGYGVTTAANGEDAAAQFAEGAFDLVITDYKMPKMNGIELIGHLRQLSPKTPLILISGFVDALGLTETSTGADAVIQKSHNEVSHLVRAVNKILRPEASGRKPAASHRPSLKAKRKSL
ncbi:MAG: response regulator [Bryobacteraceae bacterium]